MPSFFGEALAGDLILASASPRRRELLAQIDVHVDSIRPADTDENALPSELPRDCVRRLARTKAEAILADSSDWVLAGDTVVAVGRRVLGKPRDRAEAEAFLRLLSGRRHKVLTSIFLRHGERFWQRTVETVVKFKQLSDAEIGGYLSSEEWQGKAGGYAIQGRAAAFIPWINGSYTNVVGLPLSETHALLEGAGWKPSGATR